MTEEYWANSQFSIVRRTGSMRFNGYFYTIVDKLGRDIYECSKLAEKEGREKAIEPGEPCDLVRDDFIKFYRKLGRDLFIKTLDEHPRKSDKELKNVYRTVCRALKYAEE